MTWDAWRPLAVQQALYDKQFKSLKDENPEWTEEKLKKEAAKYVSLPSKDPKAPVAIYGKAATVETILYIILVKPHNN